MNDLYHFVVTLQICACKNVNTEKWSKILLGVFDRFWTIFFLLRIIDGNRKFLLVKYLTNIDYILGSWFSQLRNCFIEISSVRKLKRLDRKIIGKTINYFNK